jgi:hypothetical protein
MTQMPEPGQNRAAGGEEGRKPFTRLDLAQIHFGSGINIAAAIWLFIAPTYLGYPHILSRWNDIIVGLMLVVLAILRYSHPLHRFRISWLNAALGVWMVAAPYVLRYHVPTMQVSDWAIGAIVVFASIISDCARSYGR